MKRSKYNVDLSPAGIEKRTADNIVFHSIGEKNRYLDLKMLQRSGIIKDLRLQVPFPLVVNGVKITTYEADFVYLDQSGREVVEDFKGHKTDLYKIKSKLMIAVHGLRIIEVQ